MDGTSTNEGSVSSTHRVSPLLFQTARDTKLLPVVQLRNGVIVLMGDPSRATRLVCCLIFSHIGLVSKSCYDASLRCIGDAQSGGDHESDHIEESAAGN